MRRIIMFLPLLLAFMAYSLIAEAAVTIMPEYKGIDIDYKVLAEYKKLIRPLEPPAKAWLTETGLFLEDGSLSWSEKRILRALRKKKHQIFFLTAPRLLDGVGLMDLAFATLWSYRQDPIAALENELQDLIQKEELNLSSKALIEFRKIRRLVHDDKQVAIGLALISNFGKPVSSDFKYDIPIYNTDLALLGQIIGSGIDNKHIRPALAAALVYGAVHTIGDKELRTFLPGYVRSIVLRTHLKAPIADLTNLVWGAGGIHYPSYSGSRSKGITAWNQVYSYRPMKLKEFRWLFASAELLDSISEYFKPKNESEKLEILQKVHNRLLVQKTKAAAASVIVYNGERFWGTHVMNPEYYWKRYREGATVIGDSVDRSQLELVIARSLGLPAIMGRMIIDRGRIDHSFTLVYHGSKSGLAAFYDDIDVRRKNNVTERIQIACDKVPWDNFRFNENIYEGVKQAVNLDTNEARVLGLGIPSAYFMKDRGIQLSLISEKKEDEHDSKPVQVLKELLHR